MQILAKKRLQTLNVTFIMLLIHIFYVHECLTRFIFLQDIKDLNLTKNPAYVPTDHTDGAVGEGNAPYICPISGIEMSGKFRFVFLWSCGCVLAERALKEVKQNLCHMVRIL